MKYSRKRTLTKIVVVLASVGFAICLPGLLWLELHLQDYPRPFWWLLIPTAITGIILGTDLYFRLPRAFNLHGTHAEAEEFLKEDPANHLVFYHNEKDTQGELMKYLYDNPGMQCMWVRADTEPAAEEFLRKADPDVVSAPAIAMYGSVWPALTGQNLKEHYIAYRSQQFDYQLHVKTHGKDVPYTMPTPCIYDLVRSGAAPEKLPHTRKSLAH